VNEGMPVWHQDPLVALSLSGAALASFAALIWLWRDLGPHRRAELIMLAVLLTYAGVLATLVYRTISFATLIAVPLLAAGIARLFDRYRCEAIPARRIGMIAAMIALLMPGALLASMGQLFAEVGNAETSSLSERQKDQPESCEAAALSGALARLDKANIVAPFDIGPAILLTTPHHVLASSHHRNQRGMRDHIDIYRLPPQQSRTIIARRKLTHIILCSDEAEMKGYSNRNPAGLSAQLSKGDIPDWLVPVQMPASEMKVWLVIAP
jgi:hypothetical protein